MKPYNKFLIENEISNIRISHSLLLSLFEFFREEETDDEMLHHVAERMNTLSSMGKVLTMKDYDYIINGKG
jgi:hypothetical protein